MVGFGGKVAGVSQEVDGLLDEGGEVGIEFGRFGNTIEGSETAVASQSRGSVTNASSKRRRASSAGSWVNSASQTSAANPKRQTPTMSHRRERERVGGDFSLDITSTSWRGAH